jgi:putative flippase GtrA
VSIDIAKSVSFVAGTLFAYVANKYVTFKQQAPQESRFIAFCGLYSLTLLVNVLMNHGTLILAAGLPFAITISFLVATFCSASLNFVGMKFVVLRETGSERNFS